MDGHANQYFLTFDEETGKEVNVAGAILKVGYSLDKLARAVHYLGANPDGSEPGALEKMIIELPDCLGSFNSAMSDVANAIRELE